jgi:CRISPR-associated protein Csm3
MSEIIKETPRLSEKIIIEGVVEVLTGLMVGGSSSTLQIGGTDKQVVRHPITKMPYIPGSSLKGKMRSLFELSRGTISPEDFGPTQEPSHAAAQLFGHINRNKAKKQQPSRLIVRDGYLNNPDDLKGTELPFTEIKAENAINRITSEANPRFFERVPKGAKFDLKLVINVFDKDVNGAKYLDWTLEALRLIKDDYLGGAGSRGNGQVDFFIKTITRKKYSLQGGKPTEEPVALPGDFKSSTTAL